MKNKIGLEKVGDCVYPYPTYAEGIKALADQYTMKKLTPTSKWVMRTIMKIS